jgi:hypothetical protein
LAKKRTIDVLGCANGGADASGNAALLKLVKEWEVRRNQLFSYYCLQKRKSVLARLKYQMRK